jgi:hypothetical protein
VFRIPFFVKYATSINPSAALGWERLNLLNRAAVALCRTLFDTCNPVVVAAWTCCTWNGYYIPSCSTIIIFCLEMQWWASYLLLLSVLVLWHAEHLLFQRSCGFVVYQCLSYWAMYGLFLTGDVLENECSAVWILSLQIPFSTQMCSSCTVTPLLLCMVTSYLLIYHSSPFFSM